MIQWDGKSVIDQMKRRAGISTARVMYIAEMGAKTCKKCQEYHGKIFLETDPQKPIIPIHPNCRCRYKKLQ